MIRVLEEGVFHQFYYRRYEIDSAILERKNTFGVLQPFPFDDPQHISSLSLCFIHGGDGDDRQFVVADLLSSLSEENIAELKRKKTKIILPSIAITFLKPPIDRHLTDEIFPFVEGKNTPAERVILGLSMGGTAAFSLYLRRPDFLVRVAALFPGFIDFNPFSADSALEYQKRTGITDEKREVLKWCYHQGFQNFDDFHRYDPFEAIQKISADAFQNHSAYMDCGTQDDFALDHGIRKWSQELAKKGLRYEMSFEEGGRHDLAFVQRRLNYAMSMLLFPHK